MGGSAAAGTTSLTTLDGVDEVEDDPSLAAQVQVEVAQSNVKVHCTHSEPPLRQPHRKASGRCGFADAALARSDAHHGSSLLNVGQWSVSGGQRASNDRQARG